MIGFGAPFIIHQYINMQLDVYMLLRSSLLEMYGMLHQLID